MRVRVLFKLESGDTLPIRLLKDSTVRDVKDLLDEVLNSPGVILRFEDQVLENEITLEDLGIVDNDCMEVQIDTRKVYALVVIGPNGKKAKVRFMSTATVSKAIDVLGKVFGVSGPTQLMFDGRPLAADGVLGDLDLPENAVLQLESMPKSLTIYGDNGKIALTRFRDSVIVGKVKKVVAAQFGINPHTAVVRYDGRVIDESETLGNLQIPSTAYLEVGTAQPRSFTFSVGRSVIAKAKMGKVRSSIATMLGAKAGQVDVTVEDTQKMITVVVSEEVIPRERFSERAAPETLVRALAHALAVAPESVKVVGESVEEEDEEEQEEETANTEVLTRISVSRAIEFRFSNGKVAKTRFNEDVTVAKARDKLAEMLSVKPSALVFGSGIKNETPLAVLADLGTVFVTVLPESKTLSASRAASQSRNNGSRLSSSRLGHSRGRPHEE